MYDVPDIGVLNEDTDLHFDTGNQFRMLYLRNKSGLSSASAPTH